MPPPASITLARKPSRSRRRATARRATPPPATATTTEPLVAQRMPPALRHPGGAGYRHRRRPPRAPASISCATPPSSTEPIAPRLRVPTTRTRALILHDCSSAAAGEASPAPHAATPPNALVGAAGPHLALLVNDSTPPDADALPSDDGYPLNHLEDGY